VYYRLAITIFRMSYTCSYMVFNILPTIADIVIAIVYFISAFDIYFGLIVFGTMLLYLSEYIYSLWYYVTIPQ